MQWGRFDAFHRTFITISTNSITAFWKFSARYLFHATLIYESCMSYEGKLLLEVQLGYFVPDQSSNQSGDILRCLDNNDGLGQNLRQIHLQQRDFQIIHTTWTITTHFQARISHFIFKATVFNIKKQLLLKDLIICIVLMHGRAHLHKQ